MSKPGRSIAGTRSWPRQEIICTVLAVLPGRERLGKILDLAEGGAGAVLQGTEHRVGERIKIVLVVAGGTLAFRGSVIHVQRLHRSSRVGIRFDASRGVELTGFPRLSHSGRARLGSAGRSPHWVSPPLRHVRGHPARFNPGVASPLVAPHDALALRRDANRLVRTLRRKGVPAGRITYNDLLDLLRRRKIPRGRNLVSRELFRALMLTRYPSFPGSAVRGRVVVAAGGAEWPLLAGATVMLDRFAVAEVGACGSFSAEGIPVPDASVLLPVAIRGRGLVTTEEVLVSLRAGEGTSLFVEVPVRPLRCHPVCEDELERAYQELCSLPVAAGTTG